MTLTMSHDPAVFLSLLVFLPAVVALVHRVSARAATKRSSRFRWPTTVVVFVMTLVMIFGWTRRAVRSGRRPRCRTCSRVDWIPSFNIHYLMGIDGISFPLVVLTAFVCMLAMAASWPIKKHVKAYCILFLLLGNRACWACSWRSTSSCSTCSGK